MIVDAAMQVHMALGPGLLESAYKACLAYELRFRGLRVETEASISTTPGTRDVDRRTLYRIDLLVESAS